MDNLYTVSEVADKLNLSDKTLRRWEEAGRFRANRSIGNQRRYTTEDIQILDAIKHGSIPDQSDLLTLADAAKHCGVAEVTLVRWEREGLIHPFVTVGKTYYPRHQLLAKLPELQSAAPSPLPPAPTLPTAPPRELPRREVAPPTKPLTPSPAKSPVFNLRFTLLNLVLTLILLLGYHFFFNQSAPEPLSPQNLGSVQGVQTADPTFALLKTILDPSGALTATTVEARSGLTAPALAFTPTSAPSDPTPGTVYYDATSGALKIYRGTGWSDLAPAQVVNVKDGTFVMGSSALPPNKNQVTVDNPGISSGSTVLTTFTSDYAPAKKYWLEVAEGSFTLHTDFPVAAKAPFNYFILSTNLLETDSATGSAIF